MIARGKDGPWEFNEYLFNWPVYEFYEVVSMENPIPAEQRTYWEGVVPPASSLEVVRPVKQKEAITWNPLDGKPVLLTELAKLGVNFNKKNVLMFVSRFGLLGIENHWKGLDWYMTDADPLIFIEREAKQAARLLSLYQAVQEKDLGTIKERTKIVLFNTDQGPMANIFVDGSNIYDWPVFMPPIEDDTLLRAVLYHICREINMRLEGRMTMGCAGVTKDLAILPGVTCSSLLTAAYIQFRDVVIGSHTLRRCKYCKAIFVQTKASQKCCPKLPFGGDKPACANRAAVKKSREKKEE